MVGKITESDKDVLKRVMAEPTFAKIKEAMRRENAKRAGKLDHLRSSRVEKKEG